MMLTAFASLAFILSAVVCTCAGQNQQQRLGSITGVRIIDTSSSYGSHGLEFYGALEFNVNNREWMRGSLSGGSLTEQTGNVICRALDYGPFVRSQLQQFYGNDYYRYGHGNYGNRVNVAAIECLGDELTASQCSLKTGHELRVQDGNFLTIWCAKSACELTNRGCSHICLKNPPSANKICDCHPGYSLKPGSLTECIDSNECLSRNGGCSFNCINTIGSYLCTCPLFSVTGIQPGDCKTTGFKLSCGSNSMTVAFLKTMYPMMRDDVTLLASECVPSHNETHITLTTSYDSCMTAQSEDDGGIIYSNSVVSKDRERTNSSAIFAASINIPFKCVIRRQSKTKFSVKNLPSSLTTSPVDNGNANIRLRLFYDGAYTLALENHAIKQSAIIYASLDLPSQDSDLNFNVERCSVRAIDHDEGEFTLIRDGQPTTDFVRIGNSSAEPSFKFNYPAFTFGEGDEALALECQAKITVRLPSSSDKLSTTTAAALISSTFTRRFHQRLNFRTSPPVSSVVTSTVNVAKGSTTPRYREQTKNSTISSCDEVSADGIYQLLLGRRLVPVWCDVTSPGGPWLTVMRRNNSGLSFNRSFAEYETGFGSVDKEFWFGNAFWHEISRYHGTVLRIELTTFANESKFAEYSTAVVGDAAGGYNLTLGTYSGSAGDMRNTSGCFDSKFVEKPVKFSTYDSKYEFNYNNCTGRGGGWWYYDCMCTCLTCGLSASRQMPSRVGMTYSQYHGLFSLKKAELKLRFVHPDSVSVVHSTVKCDTQNVHVFLDRDTFGGPSEVNLTIHSISFLDQLHNETHIMLRFSLWSVDTERQENETHIVYTKLAVAETSSVASYFRRLVMKPKCIFQKLLQVDLSYEVARHDIHFEMTGDGSYDAKIIMALDESFSTLINSTSRAKEGSAVFIKVVLDKEQSDLHMALSSCNVSGASSTSSGYQIIIQRCSVHKDVEIIAKDTFVMKLPSFALDEHGTSVSCDVQVCTSIDDACDSGCGNNGFLRNNGTKFTAKSILTPTLWSQ